MRHLRLRLLTASFALSAAAVTTSCNIVGGIGAMAQLADEQKMLEIPAQYDDLADKTVAVLVDVDLSTRYEHPRLVDTVAQYVSFRIAENVPSARLVSPSHILQWQYRTPQWSTLPYSEMTAQLGVDRIVYIDISEYRLNPPGNRYEWEGIAAADVNIIERDGMDPDMFAETYTVSAKFPFDSGLGPETLSAEMVETALLNDFIRRTAWLFYLHQEPKHPDKYRPEPT
jgi:predicted small secreted protein